MANTISNWDYQPHIIQKKHFPRIPCWWRSQQTLFYLLHQHLHQFFHLVMFALHRTTWSCSVVMWLIHCAEAWALHGEDFGFETFLPRIRNNLILPLRFYSKTSTASRKHLISHNAKLMTLWTAIRNNNIPKTTLLPHRLHVVESLL